MDAPIIVDEAEGVFYKQPMFYALGHISRFIPEYSWKITIEAQNAEDKMLKFVGAQRPDGGVAVVIMNT